MVQNRQPGWVIRQRCGLSFPPASSYFSMVIGQKNNLQRITRVK
jgi:hypothetical protein